MQEKHKADQEMSDPALHQADQKNRLLKVIQQQTKLGQEEEQLMREWDELTQSIEQSQAEPVEN